ncbi:hypothetical protein CFC21_070636 [Triticum aestivum]|uniref:Uncharacterized protein n=2 Tax=Triticum aestivum TaxID=4565 RepID=A0A3B6LIH8_WHEAT|nr:hypothetical protein CFC21_070636 [Triticum aestivum]
MEEYSTRCLPLIPPITLIPPCQFLPYQKSLPLPGETHAAVRSHHQPLLRLSLSLSLYLAISLSLSLHAHVTQCVLDRRNRMSPLCHVSFRCQNNRRRSRRPTEVSRTSAYPSNLSSSPRCVENTAVVALDLVTPAPSGVAVPAGKLKAATAGVGCPGAVGNMHVLGDIGNVVHATARSSTDPATGPAWINRPIIRRFSAQLLKKAQADPSKNGVELILNSSSSAGNPEAPFAVTRRLIGTGRTPTLMHRLPSPSAASMLGCCPMDAFTTPLQPTLLPFTLWLSFRHDFDSLPYCHHAALANFSLYMQGN